MSGVRDVASAARIVLIGLVCTVLFQGCTTWEQRELVCGVKDGVPVGTYLTSQETLETKPPDGGGIKPPGGCTFTPVSGAQGEASGWVELSPTTGQPTVNTAPANARCISTNSKCKFPNTQTCTKVGGGNGTCKHAIWQGNYAVPQPCTCYCK